MNGFQYFEPPKRDQFTAVKSHDAWSASLAASLHGQLQTFRILDPKGLESTPLEADVSLQEGAPETGASQAQAGKFLVEVRYTQAPTVVLFSATYPDKDTATKVYGDLCKACAEVESKIKAAKFDEAKKSMEGLGKIFKSSTGDPGTNVTRGES